MRLDPISQTETILTERKELTDGHRIRRDTRHHRPQLAHDRPSDASSRPTITPSSYTHLNDARTIRKGTQRRRLRVDVPAAHLAIIRSTCQEPLAQRGPVETIPLCIVAR